MKFRIVLLFVFAAHFCMPAFAQDPGWPREMTYGQARLIYYEPQVDEWKEFTDLDFRFAFQLMPQGEKPSVGVANIHARTAVDVDNRTVVISDMQVTDTRFPSFEQQTAQRMGALFRKFIADRPAFSISLDRLVAAAKKAETPAGVPLKKEPPTIFVSYQPAILLQTDGSPVLSPVGTGQLQYIVNGNWPVFFDTASTRYYLFDETQWLTATRLEGPWTRATKLPDDMASVPKDPQWADLKKAIPPPAVKKKAAVPTVFYSSVPAEVILFDGQPVYADIPGTELVYANNTDADLFVHTPAKMYYYLAAGRWFRANDLRGPWTYATDALPPDFARIPLASPASRVLASVPGTEQAKDAVLLAQVPTTVTVNPQEAEAKASVEYDGAPVFKPIENTTLHYATNTPDKVIQVNNTYYLCKQGIWFYSSSPNGPWTTATAVPSEIYTIPPSSPVYNVTYVTQHVTSDGYVNSSYTAGYFGTFIMGLTVGAIIADGTGYYYPPYFYYPPVGYPVYRAYPATYGVGSVYNPYTGAYGVSQGVYGPAGGFTRTATYNPYTGTYARTASAYGPYGSRSAGRAYNPYTGGYLQGASVSTPYGSAAAARGRNPATGTAAATRQASNAYGQWGNSVVQRGGQTAVTQHASTASGSVAAGRSTSGGSAVVGSGARGTGGAAVTAGGDLYAGRDGNVYRRSGGDWQKYENGSWNSTSGQARAQAQSRAQSQSSSRASSGASSVSSGQAAAGAQRQSAPQHLNQDWQARQRGAAQSERFAGVQRSGSSSSFRSGGFGGGGRGGFGGGFGGGGFRGGGRR